MEVTVIISTYSPERLEDLSDLIDGLKKQTFKNFETIIIVDGNYDYYNFVKKRLGFTENFKVIFNQNEKGLAFSRNIGIKEAIGQIVAFIDDDAIPHPNWLEEIINTYNEDKNVVGVTGQIFPLWKDSSLKWFPKELWWIISCSYETIPLKQEVRNGFGTNISFKKNMLKHVGFFNTDLGKKGKKWIVGEESELCIRLRENTGKKIIYNPNVTVKHKVYSYRLKFTNIIKRAYYEGYSKAYLCSIYKNNILSTESNYLKQLLINFCLKSHRASTLRPSPTLKQIFIISAVVIAVGTGWFHQFTKNKILSIKEIIKF